jgi:epoxyqueuosine reductase
MASLTREIKEFALDLGYSRVGITSADDFTEHIADLESRGPMYDFFRGAAQKPLDCARPRRFIPEARSIIVLVWDYAQTAFPESLAGRIGRVFQARCYNAPPHRIHGARLQLMKDFLTAKGCAVGGGLLLPERWAGARAGVTTFGRNTFACAEGIGSFIVLNSIIIDMELDYDSPTLMNTCPEGCAACMRACPTQALYAPFKLNPRRCLGFNAWKTVEGAGWGISSCIPHDIREKMGQHVHGCDICQEVCPRNRAKLKEPKPEDPFLREIAEDFSLTKMLHMAGSFYEKRIQPLMYNYIREPKYFRRNAAVALGNSRDPAYIPDLEAEMENPEELIRTHAAWALGQIGTAAAKRILETRRTVDSSEAVRGEIGKALETILL